MIKKIFSRPQAVIGIILIAAVVICAVFAPAIVPNPPDEIDPSLKYHEADESYPLGTDQLGRCELSRLIYGARYSLGMSVPMMLILGALGLFIGTLSVCAGENVGNQTESCRAGNYMMMDFEFLIKYFLQPLKKHFLLCCIFCA